MLKFEASADRVVITWSWDVDADEDYYSPGEVYDALMNAYRPELCKEIALVNEMCEDDWRDFVSGMSTTSNHINDIKLEYRPCHGATLTLMKHICSKCGRSCGWASTYCDGTGKPLKACSDCGTTDHRHGPECVWSK